MADTLKDIPEFFETEIGESIAARTDALGKQVVSLYLFLNVSQIVCSRVLLHL